MNALQAGWVWRWAWAVLLGVLTMTAQAQAQPTLLLDTQQGLSTGGHLALLRDPGGRLSPAEASASVWHLLPGPLNAGYTTDVVWLRLRLQRPAGASERWLLQFSNALLDEVQLFRRDAQGHWQETGRSGENIGREQWPIDARYPVLPLLLTPMPDGGEVHEVLLRLKSKNAMSVYLTVSTPKVYGVFARWEYLAYGVGLGFGVLLLVFHSLFWHMSKERLSAWYLLYVAGALAVEMLTAGLPQQLFGMPVGVSDPLLGVMLCASLGVGTRFALLQLDLEARWPRFSAVLLGLIVLLSATSASWVLAGHYGIGMRLMQPAAMACVLLFVGLALFLLGRDRGQSAAFLLVFGFYYAGVVVSFLRNMGWVPTTVWTNNAAAIGTCLHMLLMSLRLNRRYEHLRREKEQVQARLVETVGRQNEYLDQAVRARTLALSQEIAQRRQLEQDLRAALETERRAKQTQLDFVAMVSHEFRTPLAIINTTAQQIARHWDAAKEKTQTRCQNLRLAAQRLTALVDDYLTADRMDTGQSPFQARDCGRNEIEGLLRDLVADWPAGRVALHEASLPTMLRCDPGLLRVALRNLLANADRHTPPGAVIALTVGCEPEPAHMLVLRVRNPGPEIPADEVPRVFEKYFRGRQAQQTPGAGLGLHLVRQIAELHGGQVGLESPGREAAVSFRMALPLGGG